MLYVITGKFALLCSCTKTAIPPTTLVDICIIQVNIQIAMPTTCVTSHRFVTYLIECDVTCTLGISADFVLITVTALIDLMTLTFDILTSIEVHGLLVWWASIVPIFGFLCFFITINLFMHCGITKLSHKPCSS